MRNQKSARKEQPSNRRLSLYKLFRPFCDIFEMPKSIFKSMTFPRFPQKIQLNDHEMLSYFLRANAAKVSKSVLGETKD